MPQDLRRAEGERRAVCRGAAGTLLRHRGDHEGRSRQLVQHDAAQAALTANSRYPSRSWAIVELLLAIAILFAGLEGYLWFSATPYLLVIGALFLWSRGPGWRAIGLRRPANWGRTIAIGAALSLYQFVSLYVIEPFLARVTNGELPDVSIFRTLVGNPVELVFWLVMSWTLAAFMEEMVFRGYLTARVAELVGSRERALVIAIVATSVIFGVAHLYQGLSGVLGTGIAGLVFGLAYLASGRNLWCAIIAHGLVDTIAFVMIYLGVYPGLD